MHDGRAVEADLLEVVAGAAGEAAAVVEQVAYRDLGRRVGVAEREPRVEVADAVVPADDALADQRGDHGGRDRLRHRGELEHRVGVDGLRRSRAPQPEALRPDHRVVVDDADCQPGNLARGDEIRGHRIDPRDRRLDPLPRDRAGESRCGDDGEQQGDPGGAIEHPVSFCPEPRLAGFGPARQYSSPGGWPS